MFQCLIMDVTAKICGIHQRVTCRIQLCDKCIEIARTWARMRGLIRVDGGKIRRLRGSYNIGIATAVKSNS
jgi:hypothetical protein